MQTRWDNENEAGFDGYPLRLALLFEQLAPIVLT